MEWNTLYKTQGSYRASIFSNFPDLKKVSKMEIKSEKIVKKSCIEFFSKLQQIVFYKWHVFVLVKSYLISPVCLQPIMKKSLFLLFSKVCIDQWPIDNLESGKRNYCFGKKVWKSLKFISWYLCKGWTVVKKKDQLGIFGSKAGMVKRTEKNCYHSCPIGSLENFDANAG